MEVIDIVPEQMLVTDEEMKELETHPDEGLVMEKLEIDGEISFGWREAEPEDENREVVDDVPIEKVPSVINTPQLYINNKYTDFDQYLPNVPRIFDFAANIEDEEPVVEAVAKENGERVDAEVKENNDTETRVSLFNIAYRLAIIVTWPCLNKHFI